MKFVENNRDLEYLRLVKGSEAVESVIENSSFVEYCNLFKGKKGEQKLSEIVSGKITTDDSFINAIRKNPKTLFSPCYSDNSENLFANPRKLTLFQYNCGVLNPTLVVNKKTSLDIIKQEFEFVKNSLGLTPSILVDSKISKRNLGKLCEFLKEQGITFLRLRWRGKFPTISKLLVLREMGFKAHISNLRTNLSFNEVKLEKRVGIVVALKPFMDIITSYSRGVFNPPQEDNSFPLLEVDFVNWNVENINSTEEKLRYAKNRVELSEQVQSLFDIHLANLPMNMFSDKLKEKGIKLF